jgi:transposase
LFRCREDAQIEFKAAAQRLGAFLLRQGVAWDRTAWTKTHLEWLGKLRFGQVCQQAAFDSYLGHVQHLLRRKAHLESLIASEAARPQWARTVGALVCLRGVGALTGFGLAVEVGDWSRLDPRRVGAYFGLTPSEYSSGQSRSQGGITKTGNAHVRRLLIEASWEHAKPYRPSSPPSLQAAWAKADPPVAARADLANRRLAAQWRKHKKSRKPATVAATAVARELAGYCRDLAVMAM